MFCSFVFLLVICLSWAVLARPAAARMPAGERVPPVQLPPLRRVLGRPGVMGELFEVEEALEKRLPGAAQVGRAGRGHDGLVGARRLHQYYQRSAQELGGGARDVQ